VFGIQIEGCARCGGRRKIIASIEEPQVVVRILGVALNYTDAR
jgi:hypothetical protein